MVVKPPDLLRDAMLDTRDPLLDTDEAMSDAIANISKRLEWLERNSSRDALDTGIARRAAAQSIPNDTLTAVIFDTEDDDTANFFDLGANPTRLTFPYAGIFLVTASIAFGVNATNVRRAQLEPNGGGIADQSDFRNAFTQGGVGTHLFVPIQTPKSAGDFYELFVFQNSGSPLNMDAKITIVTIRDDT